MFRKHGRMWLAVAVALLAAVQVALLVAFDDSLIWFAPVLAGAAAGALVLLLAGRERRLAILAVGGMAVMLAVAPTVWAVDGLKQRDAATSRHGFELGPGGPGGPGSQAGPDGAPDGMPDGAPGRDGAGMPPGMPPGMGAGNGGPGRERDERALLDRSGPDTFNHEQHPRRNGRSPEDGSGNRAGDAESRRRPDSGKAGKRSGNRSSAG